MLYPIGIQNFEKLREGGYVYVDKTSLIHKLATSGTYYFLSRPRRFGKSLLISTMEAYFKGKKEQFRGLALEKLEMTSSLPIIITLTFISTRITQKSNIIRQINEKYHDLADYGSKLHSTGSKRKSIVTRMYPVLPAVY